MNSFKLVILVGKFMWENSNLIMKIESNPKVSAGMVANVMLQRFLKIENLKGAFCYFCFLLLLLFATIGSLFFIPGFPQCMYLSPSFHSGLFTFILNHVVHQEGVWVYVSPKRVINVFHSQKGEGTAFHISIWPSDAKIKCNFGPQYEILICHVLKSTW